MKELANRAGKAVSRYGLIHENDAILVGLSGGKDSWTLLEVCLHLRDKAPIPFHVAAIHLDLGLGPSSPPGERHLSPHFKGTLETLRNLGVETFFVETDIGFRTKTMGGDSNPCFLCSRFRRGVLYRVASQLGYTKIALGHHADDLIETLLMNQFFSGQLKAMPPKLLSDDRRHEVIRPLCTVFEEFTACYTELRNIPIYPSLCSACGSSELFRRKWVKNWLSKLENQVPGLKGYLLASLTHVRASHLMDTDLFDFQKLSSEKEKKPG